MATTSGPDDLTQFRRALTRASAGLARELPWIGAEPWGVLVSEVMLQQTSAPRVIEPWTRFMELFPRVHDCAGAPLSDVLRAWEGLGFPRRARFLHETSRVLVASYDGRIPREPVVLEGLPGIGAYTSRAVAVFAYGEPFGVLDTNVGRVLARAVANRPLRYREAMHLADQVRGRADSRRHNQAMLDLGARFCRPVPRCEECPVRRQCRWHLEGGADPAPSSAAVSRPQARFEGSMRQLRGQILRLLGNGPTRRAAIDAAAQGFDAAEVTRALSGLRDDRLIEVAGGRWALAGERVV